MSSPSTTPRSLKRSRESYEQTFEQNISALEAAAQEHERVLRNAQRAQRILAANLAAAQQEQELHAEQEEKELYERKVHLAQEQLQAQQAKAELAARQAEASAAAARIPDPPKPQPVKAQSPAPRTSSALPEQPTQQEPIPSRQQVPAAQAVVQTTHATTPDATQPATNHERLHQRFLEVHQQLKKLRRDTLKIYKDDPSAKTALRSTYQGLKIDTIGDLRREMRKRVTQLTTDARSNVPSINAAKTLLSRARNIPNGPMIDARSYLADPQFQQNQNTAISALFIFLLSLLSKAVVNKFISEAGEVDRSAEPVGIAAITIFANPELCLEGTSFIDILLAKYHKACPVLFGIYGSETTEGGRRRLGWRKDANGKWVAEQEHFDRMTGLGAGFGALSLRDFSRAKSSNPLPSYHYWTALALMLNTRPESITRTHSVTIKALIEVHVEKFIGFYGGTAIAVLATAVNDFPAKALTATFETSTLAAVRDIIRTKYLLTL